MVPSVRGSLLGLRNSLVNSYILDLPFPKSLVIVSQMLIVKLDRLEEALGY